MSGQRRVGLAAALIVVAFAVPLLSFWADVTWIHPARNYYTVDTEFPYFLNSLAIFKDAPYSYVDHPGTPLAMIGTALLGLSYPLLAGSPEGFISFHIGHPGVFLDAARSFLILAHIACVVALFIAARKGGPWDETLGAAAIATMYFAVHPSSLVASTVWNHNSFSFPFGSLLLLLLYRTLSRHATDKEIPALKLVLLGMGTGVLAAITIYLAAWLIGLLVAIAVFYCVQQRPLRRTALAVGIAGASSIAGFGVAVLPVARKLPIFQNWIFSILTHQSRYLAVPTEQSTHARIVANLGALYEILPVLFVTTFVLIALAALAFWTGRRRFGSKPGVWSLIAGLVAQLVALFVVFLDRPLREAYLLSVAAILPVLTMALLSLTDERPLLRRGLSIGLGALVLAGLAVAAVSSTAAKRQETTALQATEIETSRAIRAYAQSKGRDPGDLTVLWMYGSYAPCWGLRTGDSMASNTFASEIDQVCRNQYRIGLNLRFDVHGDAIPVEQGDWDMIFTCDQYVRRLADSYPGVSVERLSSVRWGCGSMNIISRQ